MAKRHTYFKRYGYHTLNFRMAVAEVSATKGEHSKQKSCVTKSNKIQTAGIATIERQFHGTSSPGEGHSADIYTGRLRHEVQPFTFYILFFTKKVSLSYTLFRTLYFF